MSEVLKSLSEAIDLFYENDYCGYFFDSSENSSAFEVTIESPDFQYSLDGTSAFVLPEMSIFYGDSYTFDSVSNTFKLTNPQIMSLTWDGTDVETVKTTLRNTLSNKYWYRYRKYPYNVTEGALSLYHGVSESDISISLLGNSKWSVIFKSDIYIGNVIPEVTKNLINNKDELCKIYTELFGTDITTDVKVRVLIP